MSRKMWKHQKYAVEQFSDKEFFGLLLPAGTGKSLAAARIAEAKDKPVLIIAPNALCKQWESELNNKDEDTRITEKDWQTAVCTSKTRNTKAFREALDSLFN